MKFEISRSIQMTSCCMLQFFAGSICLDLSSSLAMKIASLCRGFRFAGPGCEFIIEPCNNLFEACGYNVHGPALQEKACIAVGGGKLMCHGTFHFSWLHCFGSPSVNKKELCELDCEMCSFPLRARGKINKCFPKLIDSIASIIHEPDKGMV